MTPLSLTSLLTQGLSALTTASSALAAQQARLDCSGVNHLTREQLTALFAAIPADWNMADVRAVLMTDTLSTPLERLLQVWVHVRLGSTEHDPQQPDSLTQRRGGTEAQSAGTQSESLRLCVSALNSFPAPWYYGASISLTREQKDVP